MAYDYAEMMAFLGSHNITHQEMQERWDSLKETSWVVKNLDAHGKSWTNLNELLLEDLINITDNKV